MTLGKAVFRLRGGGWVWPQPTDPTAQSALRPAVPRSEHPKPSAHGVSAASGRGHPGSAFVTSSRPVTIDIVLAALTAPDGHLWSSTGVTGGQVTWRIYTRIST